MLLTSDHLSCVEEEVWEGLMALRRFQAKIEEAETTRKVEILDLFQRLGRDKRVGQWGANVQ